MVTECENPKDQPWHPKSEISSILQISCNIGMIILHSFGVLKQIVVYRTP